MEPIDLDRLDALHAEFARAMARYDNAVPSKAADLLMFVKGHEDRLRHRPGSIHPHPATWLNRLTPAGSPRLSSREVMT